MIVRSMTSAGEKRPRVSASKVALARRGLAGVLAACLLACALAAAGCAGGGIAARYQTPAGAGELTEDEVTAYVEDYRSHVSAATTDQGWADHLEELAVSPEELRESAVKALVTRRLVEQAADERGIAVEDADVEEAIDAMKGSMAFGDDEIFAETLALSAMTEDALRELTAQQMLQEALLEAVVPKPEPTAEDMAAFLADATDEDASAKHIYYVHLPYPTGEADYETLAYAQHLQALLAADPSEAGFEAVAQQVADTADVAQDAGWSVNSGAYGAQFETAVEGTEVGAVSTVFADDTGYGFVWISEEWQPVDDAPNADALLDAPASLLTAAAEGASDQMWPEACQDYLDELYEGAAVELSPMPSGLSYDIAS